MVGAGMDARDRTASPARVARRSAFAQIAAWASDPGAPPVLLVSGAPGTGKSEVARQLVEVFGSWDSGGRVGVAVLRPKGAEHGTADAVDVLGELLRFAESLDHANVHAALERLGVGGLTVEASISVEGSVAEGSQVSAVRIHELVLGSGTSPLVLYRNVIAPTLAQGVDGRPVLVVIDAVDIDQHHTGSIGAFVTDLAQNPDGVSGAVRWIVTARPGHELGRNPGLGTVAELRLGDHAADVAELVGHRLQGGAADHAAIERVVSASAGNFGVAWALIDASGGPDGSDLSLVAATALAPFYDTLIADLATDQPDAEQLEERLCALTLIAASLEDGISADTLAALLGTTRAQARSDALALSAFTEEVDRRIRCFHRSFAYHLLSRPMTPHDAGRVRDAHLAMARYQVTDRDVYPSLTAQQRAKLPWHLVVALRQEAGGPQERETEEEVARIGWQLLHTNGWAEDLLRTGGSRIRPDPMVQQLALAITKHIDLVDQAPDPSSWRTRTTLIGWAYPAPAGGPPPP